MLKVRNMEGSSGREVANQFILEGNGERCFQSYRSLCAVWDKNKRKLTLGADCLYSTTTAKYLYQFIREETPYLFRYTFEGYKNVLIKVREKLREFFKKEDKNFEKLGYDMLHPSIENCIADGVFDDYEYFENGEIFNEEV